MFISAETASAIIQLQLASPAITHMAAAQPQPKRRFAYRDAGVGLQLRGHTCGPDNCSLGLKWALTLKWNVSPSKSNLANAEVQPKISILHDQYGAAQCAQLRLILPDPTAIGIGLRHASRALFSHDKSAAHSSVTRG
jgi:hypothetical protein